MPEQSGADASVRAAAADDAPAVTRVQAAAWRTAYADVLPAEVLAAVESAAVTGQWRDAIVAPPTARHRLLVAEEGPDVRGFAAFGPSADPDLRGEVDAELFALCVDPARAGAGHGSRLLNATVDHLLEDGFQRAHTWLPDLSGRGDDQLRAFLEAAGWGDSGARRSLDLAGDGAVVVDQVRLHTSIAPAP